MLLALWSLLNKSSQLSELPREEKEAWKVSSGVPLSPSASWFPVGASVP